MPSWPVFDAILVVWPFSEPFACGGVAISEPFACGGVAISETFACLGTCGPMHGLFFSCGSVVLSMWRCPWKLYIDVAFSLHNYVEVWPFLCVYGGVALSMWRCGDF